MSVVASKKQKSKAEFITNGQNLLIDIGNWVDAQKSVGKTTGLDGSITINISPKSVTRERRKLKKLKVKMLEGKITMKEIEGSYISWRGFAAQFDSYNTIQNMNNLYKELFGYIPVDKKTRKKKQKRKIEKRINRLYEMSKQFPSQYENESQRWGGIGIVT